jgi:prepilin-type processing-associated H-X9-DG protein
MAKRRFRLGLLIIFLALAAPFATWLSILGNERFNRWKCASNLSALGQAIFLYQNDHKGKYPPDWGTLAKEEDIAVAQLFICPSSHTSAPANMTWTQMYDWINSNSDYIYLGPDFPSSNDPHLVFAYEKLENHHGDGINVLFQDGRVRFFGREEAPKIIDQLKAHINPPRFESQGTQYYP